ncbi:hypothetical protein FHL15_004373 [Xylaria flabelliformis]|uniref:Uncharacterized protein n=1 Tax=Xylaria flabelliformis TaxID=2512241 RepID=A0A553I321_9PEZI|nr:hypothetical protein FHL15_004373 [Xylaria flabelliformis]
MPRESNNYYGASSSSTRTSSSYKSKHDAYREDRISEYGRETNYSSDRFYVTGEKSRSKDSMDRKLSQWDKDFAKASRRQ